MAAVGRRFLGNKVRLARRSFADVAPELEFLLDRLWDAETNGIPAGFNNLVPTTIDQDDLLGDPGNENSGWAAADHEHPVDADSLVERALAMAFLGY